MVIEWRGESPVRPNDAGVVRPGGAVEVNLERGRLEEIADPQKALAGLKSRKTGFRARADGLPGHRTVFAQVEQGDLRWWLPVTFEIHPGSQPPAPVDWFKPITAPLETVDLQHCFNDKVTRIFKNEYRAPRSPFCSLASPKQGIGSWCHPKDTFEVDDSGLRAQAADRGNRIVLPNGVPLATPGATDTRNIAFVSQWENYPQTISVPLSGRSSHAFLLMAGSTGAMQSRFDNGEVVVTYTDGSTSRLALHNPTTWWPIDQDYYIDDFAFARPEPLPVRVDLKSGDVRVLRLDEFKGRGRGVPGGAATVLDLPLDAGRELKSLTLRALANEVVIGLMSVTLVR